MRAGHLARAFLRTRFGVQIGQWFVNQERLRFPGRSRAAHRDSLALPAGQVSRLAVQVLGQFQHLGDVLDAAPDLGLGQLAHSQAERDVLEHR